MVAYRRIPSSFSIVRFLYHLDVLFMGSCLTCSCIVYAAAITEFMHTAFRQITVLMQHMSHPRRGINRGCPLVELTDADL